MTGEPRSYTLLTLAAFRQPPQVGGLDHVVIRSACLVRRVNERRVDEYRRVAA